MARVIAKVQIAFWLIAAAPFATYAAASTLSAEDEADAIHWAANREIFDFSEFARELSIEVSGRYVSVSRIKGHWTWDDQRVLTYMVWLLGDALSGKPEHFETRQTNHLDNRFDFRFALRKQVYVPNLIAKQPTRLVLPLLTRDDHAPLPGKPWFEDTQWDELHKKLRAAGRILEDSNANFADLLLQYPDSLNKLFDISKSNRNMLGTLFEFKLKNPAASFAEAYKYAIYAQSALFVALGRELEELSFPRIRQQPKGFSVELSVRTRKDLTAPEKEAAMQKFTPLPFTLSLGISTLGKIECVTNDGDVVVFGSEGEAKDYLKSSDDFWLPIFWTASGLEFSGTNHQYVNAFVKDSLIARLQYGHKVWVPRVNVSFPSNFETRAPEVIKDHLLGKQTPVNLLPNGKQRALELVKANEPEVNVVDPFADPTKEKADPESNARIARLRELTETSYTVPEYVRPRLAYQIKTSLKKSRVVQSLLKKFKLSLKFEISPKDYPHIANKMERQIAILRNLRLELLKTIERLELENKEKTSLFGAPEATFRQKWRLTSDILRNRKSIERTKKSIGLIDPQINVLESKASKFVLAANLRATIAALPSSDEMAYVDEQLEDLLAQLEMAAEGDNENDNVADQSKQIDDKSDMTAEERAVFEELERTTGSCRAKLAAPELTNSANASDKTTEQNRQQEAPPEATSPAPEISSTPHETPAAPAQPAEHSAPIPA